MYLEGDDNGDEQKTPQIVIAKQGLGRIISPARKAPNKGLDSGCLQLLHQLTCISPIFLWNVDLQYDKKTLFRTQFLQKGSICKNVE